MNRFWGVFGGGTQNRGDSKGWGTKRARNYDRVQPDFMHKTSVELEERLPKRISDLILFNINEVDDRNVSLKKKKKKKKTNAEMKNKNKNKSHLQNNQISMDNVSIVSE